VIEAYKKQPDLSHALYRRKVILYGYNHDYWRDSWYHFNNNTGFAGFLYGKRKVEKQFESITVYSKRS
jgi:regulation of enolase protein 1 (concanavalin A-like superfamily)